ncbi:MAG: sodium/solute symporter [Burkholderiales bacterium]|nr:sodium/solute symporter [Burkholderiales bacterium]
MGADNQDIQLAIFLACSAAIAIATYLKCRGKRQATDSRRDYFLAGGGLTWVFVAGSITLTNLSTDQLVGMNGNQMALLAWWELAAVAGLIILAKGFLPIYYRHKCTTTTELLERRYGNDSLRVLVSTLFLAGNLFIFMPVLLYTGSLVMKSMFGLGLPILVIASAFAVVGAIYAIFGGLRAVAVSDTYSGILLISMGIAVVYFSLSRIGFDLSGIPESRLTMIGSDDSPIPWHTLLTGMIFIQIFYWSTNQTITQRAMAAPNIREAQKGVFAAAAIRLVIVPPMIVIPGIVSFKLYGDIGDVAYGRIVADVMPVWSTGLFAAAMAAAVLTSFNSILNSATALYVCDIHDRLFATDDPGQSVQKLSITVMVVIVVLSLVLVPIYDGTDSIVNLVQQLYGLLSMPILSAYLVGLAFDNVDHRSAVFALVAGVLIYGVFTFIWTPLHYIHLMFVTLICCVTLALAANRIVFGKSVRLRIFGRTTDLSEEHA